MLIYISVSDFRIFVPFEDAAETFAKGIQSNNLQYIKLCEKQ